SGAPAAADNAMIAAPLPRRLPVEHLPNAIRLHPNVVSGGQPEGEAAFAELRDLGIKTVISVDGARPDVPLAKKYGLRYVHLPHGYDGVPEQRGRELAKAIRDLPGPIYLHCHHGKHRSPAAAVVGCVMAGLVPPQQAGATLQFAGTSPNYKGLYETAEAARRLDDALLDALQADFPETAQLPPFQEAMVAVEHTHDHLKLIEAAGWKTPAAHPALDPAHEALLLREHFTELLRGEMAQQQPEQFGRLLQNSEQAGHALEDALLAWKAAGQPEPIPDGISSALARITKDCKACHESFRDVPLSKKPNKL
ncbi:MAG: hypothetical protein AB7O62_19920, partial [Pirellulales bacterium]